MRGMVRVGAAGGLALLVAANDLSFADRVKLTFEVMGQTWDAFLDPSGLSSLFKSMDLGGAMTGWIDSMVLGIFRSIVESIQSMMGSVMLTPGAVGAFSMLNDIHDTLVVAGYALLIVIASWQLFKSFFSWAGFEADDPFRIGAKVIAMGFLLYHSRHLLQWMVRVNWRLMSSLTDTDAPFDFIGGLIHWLEPGNQTSVFNISFILMVYLLFKVVGCVFRMAERLILCVLLIIFSPLAFASGVSDGTKGFLQGFVRLFTGNLIIQLVQVGILACVFLYTDSVVYQAGAAEQVFHFFILIAFFKIVNRLEEIIRDMSISVGIGGGPGGPGVFAKASSMIYATQSVLNITRQLGGAR